MRDFVRFLAAWALLHDSADEAWRAAVARGERLGPSAQGGPDAFADALAALVDEEKERLRGELAASEGGGERREHVDSGLGARLDALTFEVAELRGHIESLQASVDAVAARLGA